MNLKQFLYRRYSAESRLYTETEALLHQTSAQGAQAMCRMLQIGAHGLTEEQIEANRDEYGENIITYGKKRSWLNRAARAFMNPFTAILLLLAIVSAVTDIIMPASGEKNPVTVIIITVMICLSGLLRFVQETRSGNAAASLSQMIRNTACVERHGLGKNEIPIEELVVGDIVYLSAGDMIPADLYIREAKDLFVAQATLTGESEPVEKSAAPAGDGIPLLERADMAFMGTAVVSGSGSAIVAATGSQTQLGQTAKAVQKPEKTSFEKGVNAVSWVLIRFMLVMVPVVFFINGFTKGDWLHAGLFAISVAVGLTPEMLPMIVTACLSKGAVSMSRKKVIIKNLNAIQNMGSMDLLCTDKTGTLTQDQVVLERHLDVQGREDPRVLRHAFFNSFFQTGLKNLMDRAIIERTRILCETTPVLANLETRFHKVDEIPFDFERRRMSVVVADQTGKTQLITKGAVEEMLRISAFAELDGAVLAITPALRQQILERTEQLNRDGMRVLAVAQKTNPAPVGAFSVADESEMVLIGYLAFLDPPKPTTAAAICALASHGVAVKILTGDNEHVTKSTCVKVGLEADHILTGAQIEGMSDDQLARQAEETTVFAKLSPSQKARVVKLFRQQGHVVGYMGDGINDAPAMTVADVGISVDSGVDIAKEAAGVVLLEKDLGVLEDGIIEGRKTYGNMMKYIKMTASSNFGNMFSVLAASAFLPFLPMLSIQLILLNLIYDISCTAVPWDHVDPSFLKRPSKWEASSIGRFMLWLGPVSSVFDILTYLVLFFVICPAVVGGISYFQLQDTGASDLFKAVFQTGWFIESIWTQVLAIHMIRSPQTPFLKSRASLPVTLLTFSGALIATVIPFIPGGEAFGFTKLPFIYFIWLIIAIFAYMVLITGVKRIYIKRYKEWI